MLNTAFITLANHRQAICAELKADAERVRDIETAAVALRTRGIDAQRYPPVAISMLVAQAGRSLCNEAAVGATLGHREIGKFAERQLQRLQRTWDSQSSRT